MELQEGHLIVSMPTVYVEFVSASAPVIDGRWMLHHQFAGRMVPSGVIKEFLGVSIETISVEVSGLQVVGREDALEGG